MKNDKVPVYILTGFLGSGKTTVLLKILQEYHNKKWNSGIILNELGEVNVEKNLFQDERMVELLNGCICCTIQEDLTNELSAFVQKNDELDFIIIEGTGVANPREIVDALTDPRLIDKVELASVIGLVDASNYLEYLSIFSSSKEIRMILTDQVQNTSLLLLNKTDLLDQQQLRKVRKKIAALVNENVEVIETTYGSTSVENLLRKRAQTITVSLEGEQTVEHAHEHKHHDHHHHHEHPFQAIKIEDIPMLDHVKLDIWLKSLPEGVIRGKGIIKLRDTAGLFQFQFSSKQLSLSRVKQPINEEPCIIIIGHKLAPKEITQSFQETFLAKKVY
jgi:G3E family GTPase